MNKVLIVPLTILFVSQTALVAGEKKTTFDSLAPMREHIAQQETARNRPTSTIAPQTTHHQSASTVQPSTAVQQNTDDGSSKLIGLGVTVAAVTAVYVYEQLKAWYNADEQPRRPSENGNN